MTDRPTYQQGSAQATILLAEDDMSVAVPLIIGLQGEGFQVLHAVDGHWALELARAAQPDLILADVRLPRMDGLTVCRTLRQSSEQAPSTTPFGGLRTTLRRSSGDALSLSKGQGLGQAWRRASTVSIILLATQGQERERIRGLELGADGCLVQALQLPGVAGPRAGDVALAWVERWQWLLARGAHRSGRHRTGPHDAPGVARRPSCATAAAGVRSVECTDGGGRQGGSPPRVVEPGVGRGLDRVIPARWTCISVGYERSWRIVLQHRATFRRCVGTDIALWARQWGCRKTESHV